MTELERAKEIICFSSHPVIMMIRLYLRVKSLVGIELKDEDILNIYHSILKLISKK